MRDRLPWVAACLACVVVGGFLGRMTAASADPAPLPEEAVKGAAPPWWPKSEPVPAGGQDDLQAELQLERARRQALELELYGEPLTWADDAPPEKREAGFTDAMDEVLEQCRPAWDFAQMDCSEPPCMAAIWVEEGEQGGVSDCPAWVERYGVATAQSTGPVDCGDGRTHRLLVLSPSDTFVGPDDDMFELIKAEDKDPEEQKNRFKRMQTRWNELRQDLPCPAGQGPE